MIQFRVSHLISLSLNVKQFYLTHRMDLIRCYHSRLEWTWKLRQWRGTSHSLKLQHYWSLTIKLFSGGFTPQQSCSWCILQPQLTGLNTFWSVVFVEIQDCKTTAHSIFTKPHSSFSCNFSSFLNWKFISRIIFEDLKNIKRNTMA